MTDLHRTGGASVGSQRRPPADGGQQPEGLIVPAVGTDTQERSSEASGEPHPTRPLAVAPAYRRKPCARTVYVRGRWSQYARTMLCSFPVAASLRRWEPGENPGRLHEQDPWNTPRAEWRRWRCPECGCIFVLNPMASQWFQA